MLLLNEVEHSAMIAVNYVICTTSIQKCADRAKGTVFFLCIFGCVYYVFTGHTILILQKMFAATGRLCCIVRYDQKHFKISEIISKCVIRKENII